MGDESKKKELINKINKLEQEITECKLSNEALRKDTEKYHLIAENAGDPIIFIRKERIEYCNPVMEELIGYSRSDILGKHFLDIVTPDNRSRILDYYKKRIKEESSVEQQEVKLITRKGDPLTLEIRPMIIESQGIPAGVAVIGGIGNRKHREEVMRESEERYRILAENVADGVAIIRDKKFAFANNALAAMFGYTPDQLMIIDPVLLFHDKYKAHYRELIENLENGVPVKHFQAPCICSDGRQIWIEGHNNIIQWQDRTAFLITIRDITDSKMRELAIEEERKNLKKENIKLKASLKERYRFGNIIGKSPAMQEVYELILEATTTDANIVIYGESGTGKEVIAKTIHDMSDRAEKSFVPVNCGAIPESLFESEFFGHRKGAFTGAHADKHGFFDLAHEGTLFLDEVGELTHNMQVKLLRAVEGKGYTPIGDKSVQTSDVRILGATNRDLTDHVRKGIMREDFFYRIHVIPIQLPPLRDRQEDIPLLIDHFLKNNKFGNGHRAIPSKIMDSLCSYQWPGNVRELQNVLHRYFTVNRLDFLHSPEPDAVEMDLTSDGPFEGDEPALRAALKSFEKGFISNALQKNCWHRGKTATLLGIPSRTLHRKIKKFELLSS